MKKMQKTILYGNQIQISEPLLITEENAFLTEKFDCGNEVINHYLKSEAKKIHKLFLSDY